jgi:uncharacterized protein YjeT (DUF2065 family)
VDSIWVELGRAFCLLLIIEGIIPFLYPDRWRQLLETVSGTDDKMLRLVGLFSMLLGLGILYLL